MNNNSKNFESCKAIDHTNCNWRCNVKQNERVKKYYREKQKNNKIKCERCNSVVIEKYLSKHQITDKCKYYSNESN